MFSKLLLLASSVAYCKDQRLSDLKMVFQVSRHCTRGVGAGGIFPYLIKPGYEHIEFNDKRECLPAGEAKIAEMSEFIRERYGGFIDFNESDLNKIS